jgi:uncharacterized HAD superfamily protein
MKTIIFDVDGCLADFVKGFTTDVIARDPLSTLTPWGTRENKGRWDFSDVFDKKLVNEAWKRIHSSRDWWEGLPALEGQDVFNDIDHLQRSHHVLFVTARPGINSQEQTRHWLWNHGIGAPHVVVTAKKGEVANAVSADFHVDDKPENAACVHWMSECTKSYFVEHPYRQGGVWLPERIKRIKTVKEYISDIKETI